MFQFLLGVLILASNFLGVSRATAEMGTSPGSGIKTIPIRGRARWAGLALALLLPAAANAQNAYITNANDSTVSVIDTATNTVVGTPISVNIGPFGVAVTPDGTKAYVTTIGPSGSMVSVIATATNTVVATIPGSNPSYGVAVTPDGAKVYVANDSGTVSVIDTATNTVSATIQVGNSPYGVAVTPDGTKVYVTNATAPGAVWVIATATNTVVATFPVGSFSSYPYGVAVTPDGAKVYVANTSDNTVSEIATATNTVVATIPVGRTPAAFGKFIGGNACVPPVRPAGVRPAAFQVISSHPGSIAQSPGVSPNTAEAPVVHKPRIPIGALKRIKNGPRPANSTAGTASVITATARAPSAVKQACATNAVGTPPHAPSDSHAAAGLTNFIVTTNNDIGVYRKSDRFRTNFAPLATFFKPAGVAATQTLFDARVLFDPSTKPPRYFVTAMSTDSTNTDQFQYFAVSRESYH